jgi:hypothetical protein
MKYIGWVIGESRNSVTPFGQQLALDETTTRFTSEPSALTAALEVKVRLDHAVRLRSPQRPDFIEALRNDRRLESRVLLGPDSPAAAVHPGCPLEHVVRNPPYDGTVAVCGQRDRGTLSCVPNRAGADQFTALLGPDGPAAGEDPCCPCIRVVVRPAHDGGVAVGGQRD